jgi:glycosyltransferase involved in cell wall biosynthesis
MHYKPDTLVILSPGFPENEADTACLPLQQSLVKTIQQNNPSLKVVILSFHYPFKKQSYSWNGIQVEAFGGKSRGKLFRLYNWIKIWQALKKIKQTHNIKGLLSFWLGECAFIGKQFARQYHLKHYCWILGQDAKAGNSYFKMINPKPDTLVAISDLIAQNIKDNYGMMPAHIITGGINDAQSGKPSPEKSIDILGVGSLIPLKQYHLFIEVVCRLRRQFPDIKVVLCGDGPERERLAQMIRKLDLEQNITLTGSIPHAEVLALMQQTKVFLHPSNYEGLVMVCLEALNAGAKVISFVRCMNEPIKNWYSLNSTLDMAALITEILANPYTEYTAVTPYKIEDVAEKMLQLYLIKPTATALKRSAIASKERVAS